MSLTSSSVGVADGDSVVVFGKGASHWHCWDRLFRSGDKDCMDDIVGLCVCL